MAYELLGMAMMATLTDLSNTEVSVLMFLCGFANSKTGQCNPSQATLADRARITRRSAVRALNGLEEKGYIKRKQNFRSDGGTASCSYIINVQRLPEHHQAAVAAGVNVCPAPCDTVSHGLGHNVSPPGTQCHTNQE